MTKAEAKAFQNGWQIVGEIERKSTQQDSLAKKYRQFLVLMSWAKELGWHRFLAEGENEVRDRWARLRKEHRG